MGAAPSSRCESAKDEFKRPSISVHGKWKTSYNYIDEQRVNPGHVEYTKSTFSADLKIIAGSTHFAHKNVDERFIRSLYRGLSRLDESREDVVCFKLTHEGNDTVLKAHKTIVCGRCEHFNRVFEESQQKQVDVETGIDYLQPESFTRFLEFLYLDYLTHQTTDEQIIDLLHLSKMYTIDSLTNYCEHVLSFMINPNNVLSLLRVSVSMELTSLAGQCLLAIDKDPAFKFQLRNMLVASVQEEDKRLLVLIQYYNPPNKGIIMLPPKSKIPVTQNLDIKMAVLGAPKSGKSSLVVKFTQDIWFGNDYKPETDESYRKAFTLDSGAVSLELLDTTEHPEFKPLRNMFLAETDIFIFCYSTTDVNSFNEVRTRIEDTVRELGRDDITGVIVGTKVDLAELRQVRVDEGQNLAQEYNFSFVESSVKYGLNVDEVFQESIRVFACKDNVAVR